MENQTRFDLNAEIESWRNELAAQPNLASDDRRELETHLRDAIAGFQQRGLNDEESFWLARRRVGQPQPLDEEFVKSNPARVWRERFFWTAIILLTIRAWTEVSLIVCSFCQGLAAHILHGNHFVSNIDLYAWLCGPTSDVVLGYLSLLPVVVIVFLLSCGRLSQTIFMDTEYLQFTTPFSDHFIICFFGVFFVDRKRRVAICKSAERHFIIFDCFERVDGIGVYHLAHFYHRVAHAAAKSKDFKTCLNNYGKPNPFRPERRH